MATMSHLITLPPYRRLEERERERETETDRQTERERERL